MARKLNAVELSTSVAGKANTALRQQYVSDVDMFAATTQAAVMRASPELRRISDFLESRFSSDLPQPIAESYQDKLRTAQAARGFGGGGSGVAGEEARFLFGVAEQQRRELLPSYQAFAQTKLGLSGFGSGPQQISAGDAMNMMATQQQLRLQKKQFKHQRNMSYVNAATSIVGAVTGGLGNLAGAYSSYQGGQATAQNNALAAQYGQPLMQRAMYGNVGQIMNPTFTNPLSAAAAGLQPRYDSYFGGMGQ